MGPVRENLLFGWPDASDDEIVAAARAANADEFIVQLPDEYDTIIGERGVRLSGGQKQRLSIARALLKNAPIYHLGRSYLVGRQRKRVADPRSDVQPGRAAHHHSDCAPPVDGQKCGSASGPKPRPDRRDGDSRRPDSGGWFLRGDDPSVHRQPQLDGACAKLGSDRHQLTGVNYEGC